MIPFIPESHLSICLKNICSRESDGNNVALFIYLQKCVFQNASYMDIHVHYALRLVATKFVRCFVFSVRFLQRPFSKRHFDMNTFAACYLFLDSICESNSRARWIFRLFFIIAFLRCYSAWLGCKWNQAVGGEHTKLHISPNKSVLKGMLSVKHLNENRIDKLNKLWFLSFSIFSHILFFLSFFFVSPCHTWFCWMASAAIVSDA